MLTMFCCQDRDRSKCRWWHLPVATHPDCITEPSFERKRPSLRRQNVPTGKCNSSIIEWAPVKIPSSWERCRIACELDQCRQDSPAGWECKKQMPQVSSRKSRTAAQHRSSRGAVLSQNALDTEAQTRAVLKRAIQRTKRIGYRGPSARCPRTGPAAPSRITELTALPAEPQCRASELGLLASLEGL